MDRASSFSSRDEVFEEENKYWALKIKELESYDDWDKQYILGKGMIEHANQIVSYCK